MDIKKVKASKDEIARAVETTKEIVHALEVLGGPVHYGSGRNTRARAKKVLEQFIYKCCFAIEDSHSHAILKDRKEGK